MDHDPPVPNNMLDTVRAKLKADTRSIAKLHQDLNGTGLGYHWLRKMKAGTIKNPGAERVSKLYTALTC